MKRRASLMSIVILIFIISGYGFASAEVYNLDDCINIAAKNNYGVIAARNTYDAARGEVYTAWGSLFPTISISAVASQGWSARPKLDPTSGRLLTKYDTYSGSIELGRTYAGFGLYNYADIKKKYHDRGSSFYGFVGATSQLVLNVKSSYYDLLKASMLLDVSKDAVKRGEERLRVVQSKYDLGSASMSDVLKAKVQYGSDRLDLVSKTNAYNLAKANLAYLIGIDVNKDFDVDKELPERKIDITFDAALDEALLNNPDFKKANFELAGARDQKLMAYSNFLPSVRLGLSHGTSVTRFSDFLQFRNEFADWRIFASLNFNIFNGASDYAALLASKKNVNTNEQALKDTENKVALDVKQAFLDIEQSDEAKKLAGESVSAAQEDLNLVKEKYNLGAATILEVLDAEVSLKQAQTDQVQAIFDYNLAISKLESVLGR